MPLSVGGLLQGLTQGATGALAGVNARQERERQAMHELLAQRLAEAQISNLQSQVKTRGQAKPGAKKLQHLQDPVTGQVYNYDPDEGTLSPTTMATPTPPAPMPVPQQPTVAPQPQQARLHVKVPPPKLPTPAERVAGSQAGAVEQSVALMEQLESDPKNAAAIEQAAAAIRAGKLPGPLGAAAQFGKSLFLDPVANQYFTAASNVLLATTPTYGGARPTPQLLALEADAILPSPGEGEPARALKRKTRRQRLRDLRAKAGAAPSGSAEPDGLPAQVPATDLQNPAPTGGVTPRYHAKFRGSP